MFIYGGFDLKVILYSLQIKQRRKQKNKERKQGGKEGRKEGTIQIEFCFSSYTRSLLLYNSRLYNSYAVLKCLNCFISIQIPQTRDCNQIFMYQEKSNTNKVILIWGALELDFFEPFYLKKDHDSPGIILRTFL